MFRRTRRRERTEWFGYIVTTPTVVAVNTVDTKTLVTPAISEEWPNGRIDRIIGTLFFSPATAPAAASGYGIFFGFTKAITGTTIDPELLPDHRWSHWGAAFPQIGGNGAADSNASRWVDTFDLIWTSGPDGECNLTMLATCSSKTATAPLPASSTALLFDF